MKAPSPNCGGGEQDMGRFRRSPVRRWHLRQWSVLRKRAFGLLLVWALAGCATTPHDEAVSRMTGFELEVLGKLETLRKGMTYEEVLAVMGPNDDGSLFQEAARYWVLSTRPIIVTLPETARFDSLALCIKEGMTKFNVGLLSAKAAEGIFPAGTYRCIVDSPAQMEKWRSALVAELPTRARLETPVDPKERDTVAKLVFSKGRLSSAYLIHPAPSPRGAFYYVVIE